MDNKKIIGHIVQYPGSYSQCVGCHSCELYCSLAHEGFTSPSHARIKVDLGPHNVMLPRVYACEQCADHPCYDACPKKDKAMCLTEDGLVVINEAECVGCGKCQRACRLTPSRINLAVTKGSRFRKAKKCDLCYSRPEGPACIQHCPVLSLGLSTQPLPYTEDNT